jgi:hypothetical protein
MHEAVRPDLRSRQDPGTHVAENSGDVKRFARRNLGRMPRFANEIRINTLRKRVRSPSVAVAHRRVTAGNPSTPSVVGGPMPTLPSSMPVRRRSSLTGLATIVAAVALAACSSAPSPSSTGSPGASPAPSASPSTGPIAAGAIDHRTGATDVVLRLESGGGFVPIDFLASHAPTFTLYGNGVIVFQRKVDTFPQPDASGVTHGLPWRTAKLDESQIQELLEFAITQGALGTARDAYVAGGIADAPNTIFTIRAGGLDKTVTVNALSDVATDVPDAAARAAFLKLANRLSDIDRGGTIDSDVYAPAAYRGILLGGDAGVIAPKAWPWPAIKPTDFKDPNAANGGGPLANRILTVDDVAALDLTDVAGGLQGVVLKGPDGKIYSLTVRPLLPDEKE